MSEHKKPSASRLLHEAISVQAQRLVDGNDSIDSVHADIVELVNDYRGRMPDRITDPNIKELQRVAEKGSFPSGSGHRIVLQERPYPEEDVKYIRAEEQKRLRIVRETALAATSRVMGDIIIQKVLRYSTESGIDMRAMMEGYRPAQFYYEGMTNFLDESVDEAVTAMGDGGHQYHALFRYAARVDEEYLSLTENEAKRTGVKLKTWNNIYTTLQDMYTTNHQDMVAPFMVMHGIAMQSHRQELPDGETLSARTAGVRPHWLSLATMSRVAFQNIFFGDNLALRLRDDAERIGTFPSWFTTWPQAMTYVMRESPGAFTGCPLESPLLDMTPETTRPFKSPGHCSGNIALSASPEANKRATQLFGLLDGEITADGRYLPAALLIDLGRVAARYAFGDPSFRLALIKGRQACDEREYWRGAEAPA